MKIFEDFVLQYKYLTYKFWITANIKYKLFVIFNTQ